MSKIEVDAIDKQSGSTLTLGGAGTAVTLACGATQTGFGRTGTVDWDTTPKTTTFTAVAGDGFFCNTTSGGFTCNLPAGTAGAIVSLADYAGTWQTGNLTVSPNGTDKIGGVNSNVVLSTEGQSVTFVFADSTQGWINVQDSTSNERGNAFIVATGGTETTSGNDKIHTFTGPGTFTVSTTALCAANNLVSYLVVGSGGSGGNGGGYGGGGGAGGFREVKSPSTPYTASPLDGYSTPGNRITVTAQGYPIVVGGGGAGVGPSYPGKGNNGNVSTFSTITGAAGGAGGTGANPPGGAPTAPTVAPGNPGGSGGGAGGFGPGTQPGGTGNTPPVTPAQGTNGGATTSPGAGYSSAGGGGATVAGVASTNPGSPGPAGANGGNGADTSISGTPTTYAGGGGGGGWCASGGSGGSGGGGTGSRNNGSPNATDGPDNRGGGGGGGSKSYPVSDPSGAGGSGIVIIRYKIQ
jgi:hypothetical protein